jgi:hypothetical protein
MQPANVDFAQIIDENPETVEPNGFLHGVYAFQILWYDKVAVLKGQ